MIIDFHTHVFPPQIKKNRQKYIDSDPCFAILYSQKDAKIVTADELIASMDRDGVDISVIQNIGWTTHELCIETNDYILESIARYPGRLIAFCSVQPQAYDAALKEIERCANAGAQGIGELRPDTQLFDLTDEELMQPFVETLVKHDLPLLLHTSEPVGHIYHGKGTITPDTLYPFITRFPDLNLVCAHWGGGLPFYALMPEVKKAFTNVYFDTAASPFLYSPGIYRHVAELVGSEKILLGSDFPLMPTSRLVNEIMSADLPEEEKNLILADNARRLLGIEGG
jgi:predicted TIM-barrel fold metal-dependent hydrolase